MMKTSVNSSAEAPHRGITMHQLSFGGGFPGLVFAVGSALIFLIALPQLWYFLGLALGLGICVAAILRLSDR
jgi:hypothetical protein